MSQPSFLPRNDRYLRNRPFLCIEFVQRPAKGVNTAKAGWQHVTGNVASFEKPSVVDRINDTQMRSANVIIDVLNSKCIKGVTDDVSEEQIVGYFLEKYRDQVKEAMDIWLTKLAKNVVATEKQAAADGVYSAN